MSVHKDLTGADLHEPKGADTATSGKVYVSDGAGSGAWTTASSIITNTAFTTGDLKLTHKTTADTGWIMWSDGTFGDGSSGGTIRANADTEDLFTHYWTINYTGISISGGRGASAAADFAAHKTLKPPVGAGRAFVLAGSGSGLTTRTIAETTGSETVTLAAGNIPTLTSTNSAQNISVSTVGYNFPVSTGLWADLTIDAGTNYNGVYAPSGVTYLNGMSSSNSITTTYTNASPTAISNMQPSTFVNVMIKL